MALTFQRITLDTNSPDRHATLVLREGQLLAVLSCLSDIHGDLAGHWYIEAAFGAMPTPKPLTFASLGDLKQWFASAPDEGTA